jgi:hypothetical protein
MKKNLVTPVLEPAIDDFCYLIAQCAIAQLNPPQPSESQKKESNKPHGGSQTGSVSS